MITRDQAKQLLDEHGLILDLFGADIGEAMVRIHHNTEWLYFWGHVTGALRAIAGDESSFVQNWPSYTPLGNCAIDYSTTDPRLLLQSIFIKNTYYLQEMYEELAKDDTLRNSIERMMKWLPADSEARKKIYTPEYADKRTALMNEVKKFHHEISHYLILMPSDSIARSYRSHGTFCYDQHHRELLALHPHTTGSLFSNAVKSAANAHMQREHHPAQANEQTRLKK